MKKYPQTCVYKYTWQLQSPTTPLLWPVRSYFSAPFAYILLINKEGQTIGKNCLNQHFTTGCWTSSQADPREFLIGNHTSSTSVLNTGAPQDCVLSPLQFTLYTHYCNPRRRENSTVKYADNTTIIGCIIKNGERSYHEEINNFAEWCTENKLLLNGADCHLFSEINNDTHPCLHQLTEVEQVNSYSFLGITSLFLSLEDCKPQKRLLFICTLNTSKFRRTYFCLKNIVCPNNFHCEEFIGNKTHLPPKYWRFFFVCFYSCSVGN